MVSLKSEKSPITVRASTDIHGMEYIRQMIYVLEISINETLSSNGDVESEV